MDLILLEETDDDGITIYMVFNGKEWIASFANKIDAEDFMEMLVAREEQQQSFKHPS